MTAEPTDEPDAEDFRRLIAGFESLTISAAIRDAASADRAFASELLDAARDDPAWTRGLVAYLIRMLRLAADSCRETGRFLQRRPEFAERLGRELEREGEDLERRLLSENLMPEDAG
jgi:hypothetical protein